MVLFLQQFIKSYSFGTRMANLRWSKQKFYVNNKSSDEKEIFFYWDVNRVFLLINKAIEKMDKTKET